MRRTTQPSVIGLVLSALCLCACQVTESPKPVPLPEDSAGLHLKELSETRWTVWLDLKDEQLQPQLDPQFCWAAVVRAIQLRTTGQSLEQEQLYAKHIWGLPGDKRKAGFKHEIQDALAGGYGDKFNQRYVIDLVDHANLSEREIILSLSAGEPVLVGLGSSEVSPEGHICLIYGVQYEEIDVGLGDRLVDAAVDTGLDFADWLDSLGDDQDATRQAGALNQTARTMSVMSDAVSGHQYRILKVYFWDPWNLDIDGDGVIDGGKMSYDAEDFFAVYDFSMSRISAATLSQEQLEWVERHADGPGVYIRHPSSRSGKPVYTATLESFDPAMIGQLMSQFGLATQEQRANAGAKPARGELPAP